MKKQILTLTFLVMAMIFAGVNMSYGQTETPYWSDVQIVACEADELHPQAGVPYTYSGSVVDNSTGTSGGWRFWATKDPNFIQTAADGTVDMNFDDALAVAVGQLEDASSDYNIEIGQAAADDDGAVTITWSATLLNNTEYQTNPTFVVAYYVNEAGCTDNIKVWELDPINPFVVDVIAMNPSDFAGSKNDFTTVPQTCVDVVEKATYSGGSVSYDFGDNYLYFEFIAANYAEHWVPTFQIDPADLGTTQLVTSYEYTTTTPDNWDGSETWTTLESGVTQLTQEASVTDVTQSSSIFVRVLIDHNQYENINGQTLTMILDGQDQSGLWDVVNDTCDDPAAADQNDTADSEITPRPNIEALNSTTSTIAPNLQMVGGDQEN